MGPAGTAFVDGSLMGSLSAKEIDGARVILPDSSEPPEDRIAPTWRCLATTLASVPLIDHPEWQ